MSKPDRALVILAAYDYESLAVTLQSLEHTISPEELVVVVLNGRRFTPAGEKTERVARTWAASNPKIRHVMRPLCSGSSAYFALTEALAQYPPLQEVRQICKIDDDLIPVRSGWLERLSETYNLLATKESVGFVTGMINNNSWGFKELVDVFGKKEAYDLMFDYVSLAGDFGERKVPAGHIDAGAGGTVWNYPYLAWWIHQWTSLDLKNFVARTQGLGLKKIDTAIHYSIGCIYFEKSFWLSMNSKEYHSSFDELLLHLHCKETQSTKWALQNEPMIHLFYRTQRQANSALFTQLLPELSHFFNDQSFLAIESLSSTDNLFQLEEVAQDLKGKVGYIHKKLNAFSFVKNWKEKQKRKKLWGL